MNVKKNSTSISKRCPYIIKKISFNLDIVNTDNDWFNHKWSDAQQMNPPKAYFLQLTEFEEAQLKLPFADTVDSVTAGMLKSNSQTFQIKMTLRYYSSFSTDQYSLAICAQHIQDRCKDLPNTNAHWQTAALEWLWVEAEKVEFRFIFRPASSAGKINENDLPNLPTIIVSDLVAKLLNQDGVGLNLCSLQTQRLQILITIDGKAIRVEHNNLLWVAMNLPLMPQSFINNIESNNDTNQNDAMTFESETSLASRGSLLYSLNKNAQISLTLAGNAREILPEEELCVRFNYWLAESRTLKLSLYHDRCTKRLTLAKLTPTFTAKTRKIEKGERISWYPARVCFGWFVVQLNHFRTDQLQFELKIEGELKIPHLFIERRSNEALFGITDLIIEQNIPSYESGDEGHDEHSVDERNFQINHHNEFSSRDSDLETDAETYDTSLEDFADSDEDDPMHDRHIAVQELGNHSRSTFDRRPNSVLRSPTETLRNRINDNDFHARSSLVRNDRQIIPNSLSDTLARSNNKNELDIQDFLSSWNTNGEHAIQEWQMLPDHEPFIRWQIDENQNQVALQFRLSPVEATQNLYAFSRWVRVVPNEVLTLQLYSTLRGASIKIELLNEQLDHYIWSSERFETWPMEKTLNVFITPNFLNKYTRRIGKFKISIVKKDLNLRPTAPKEKQMDSDNGKPSYSSRSEATRVATNFKPVEREETFTHVPVQVDEEENTNDKTILSEKTPSEYSNEDDEILIIKGLHMSDPCNDAKACHGHGICLVENAHSYSCHCSEQFHGTHCEYENTCRKNISSLEGNTGSQYCDSVGAVNCRPVENWFDCQCRAGHRWDVHKRRCETISPCLFRFCQQGEICRETQEMMPYCECKPGHKLNKMTKRCEPDLCKPDSCKQGQLCSTVPGIATPVCYCSFGQWLNPELQCCVPDSPSRRNPFIVQVLRCNQSYEHDRRTKELKCACFDGYRLDSNHIDCKPIESFERNRCPPCSNTQVCVQKFIETPMSIDVHYACECRVGFYGSNCAQNVCEKPPSANIRRRQIRAIGLATNNGELQNDLSLLGLSRPKTVQNELHDPQRHQALPFGYRTASVPNEPQVWRSRSRRLKRVQVPLQFGTKRTRLQTATQRLGSEESLAESSRSEGSSNRGSNNRQSSERPTSPFSGQTDETSHSNPELRRSRAGASEHLNPERIVQLELERKLLRAYCDYSGCNYDKHRRQFRCHCLKDRSIVDENNGLCRFKPVCNEQDRIACSERNAICVPRFQKSGSSLISSCECPPGYEFNKERFCQSMCTFLHKTCEEMNADRCEVDLRNNAARCICRAGHVYDLNLRLCVVTQEVLRVRMNIRLNHLRLETDNKDDFWSPPNPDDPSSVHFFPFLSDDDDLHREISRSEKILGPAPFLNTNIPHKHLQPVDCTRFYQTNLCVEWLNKVNQLQRYWVYDVLSHIRLQYRLRRSLQAALDRMLGPHVLAKVYLLRFGNKSSIFKESSGLGTVFAVDFTLDIVKPKHIHSKQILELFRVSCVHLDQMNRMHLQPPFVINLNEEQAQAEGKTLLYTIFRYKNYYPCLRRFFRFRIR